MVKFSPLGRQKLEEELEKLHEGVSSVEYVFRYLRPFIRKVIIAITAGEGVHPEVIRMQLGVFVKSAALRATVYTIPSEENGLRLQSSKVHIGVPGVGKGLGCSWGDAIMEKSKAMARKYMNDESKKIIEAKEEAKDGDQVVHRLIFKDIDGSRKVGDLELPGLLELPTWSCDALLLRAS